MTTIEQAPPETPLTVEELRAAWYADDVSVEHQSYWGGVGRRFLKNKLGVAALVVMTVIILAAVFAPLLTGSDPLLGNPTTRLRPLFSPGHPFGTDEQGRDMLARIMYGGRLSLIAGFLPTVLATVIGTVIGTTAGYRRGKTGTGLMRTMDMLYAFPAVLLAVAVAGSLGPGLRNSIIAVTIVFIPPVARVAEGATRSVVNQEYMEAARLSGAGQWKLVRTQLLPNVLNSILVYASGLVGVAMIIAASLSFLGLGSPPPAPEWGFMLNSLRGSLYNAPWVAAIPGLFICLTSIAFNTASDALREAMDTRLSTT
jgi:peptide/nickel transport system permease protein